MIWLQSFQKGSNPWKYRHGNRVHGKKITRDHHYFWAPSFVLLTSISLVSGCLMMSPFSPMCMETFLGIRISMHGIRDFLYRHTNLLQQRLESHRFESNETMHASIASSAFCCVCVIVCTISQKYISTMQCPLLHVKWPLQLVLFSESQMFQCQVLGWEFLPSKVFSLNDKNVSGAWFLDKNFSRLLIIDFRRLNAQSSALTNL